MELNTISREIENLHSTFKKALMNTSQVYIRIHLIISKKRKDLHVNLNKYIETKVHQIKQEIVKSVSERREDFDQINSLAEQAIDDMYSQIKQEAIGRDESDKKFMQEGLDNVDNLRD